MPDGDQEKNGRTLNPDNAMEIDFTLHLYDKLWENINNRETRVWTFLSVMGAAIGVALSLSPAERLVGAGVELAVVVTSAWAARMLIDADWWSIRNRLMVGRIERFFPLAHDSIIPDLYKGTKFTSNALSRFGVVVLHGAGVAAVWLSALRLVERGIGSVIELFLFYLLIGLMLVFIARSVTAYNNRVDEYYQLVTKEEVDACDDQTRDLVVANKTAEDKTGLGLSWPARVGVALIWLAALVVVIDATTLSMMWLIAPVLMSIALVSLAVHGLWPSSDTHTSAAKAGQMPRWTLATLLSIAFLTMLITSGWTVAVENRWLPRYAERVDSGLATLAAMVDGVAQVGERLAATNENLARSFAKGLATHQALTERELDETAARRIVSEAVKPLLERLDRLEVEIGAIRSDFSTHEASPTGDADPMLAPDGE